MIIRSKRKHGYTIVPNATFEDTRISYAARGLLGSLLVKPDDWKVRVSGLQKAGGAGRDQIYRLLDELIEAGYIVRTQPRTGRGAAPVDYTVYDIPQNQLTGNPDAGNTEAAGLLPESQDPGNQLTGNPDALTSNKKAPSNHTGPEKEQGSKKKSLGEGTNGVPVAAPLAAHTNGSTQPEPLASPGLPSGAVNGASPAAAGELDDSPAPAKPKRSARNGKASGADAAEPNPERAAESKLVFGELCTWLKMDSAHLTDGVRGRLNKIAKSVLDADLDAEVVKRARLNWSGIWPGTLGQAPTYGQMETQITQAGAVPATTNFDEVW